MGSTRQSRYRRFATPSPSKPPLSLLNFPQPGFAHSALREKWYGVLPRAGDDWLQTRLRKVFGGLVRFCDPAVIGWRIDADIGFESTLGKVLQIFTIIWQAGSLKGSSVMCAKSKVFTFPQHFSTGCGENHESGHPKAPKSAVFCVFSWK